MARAYAETALERYLLSRRSLLRGAGGFAAYAAIPGLGGGAPVIRLRLLETSDLHMFIYDYDYYRDRPDATVGLAKTAQLMAEARAEAPNCLLFDNGDTIQGNPLSDFVAGGGAPAADGVHPMFRVMNMLGYDAGALGNHEFNYGLHFLGRATAGAHFPIVCSNLSWADGRPYAPPFAVLERDLVASDGRHHSLRIGVIGFVPPQVTVWDKARLDGKITSVGIVEAAARHLPALRRQCDLVIALCHSGIGREDRGVQTENAALQLAKLPGFDAIFTGHSHRVFPGPDYAGIDGVDTERGTLAGVPAVMPGYWGSHLGVIDLTLTRQGGAWKVAAATAEARPIYRREASKAVALVADDARVIDAARPEHEAAIAFVSRPIGRTAKPIASYFAMIEDDWSLGLINDAQLWYARPLLENTPHAGLPLLSAASPMKAGGSPDSFTDIPAGPLALRNIADLYIYPNLVTAVRIDGARLRDWLERSASFFARLDPADERPQPLLAGHRPAYNFDVIAGIAYQIDLTRPARYGADGQPVPGGGRIVDLTWNGQAVTDGQEFVVVTNNYRAAGGGGFLDGSGIVLEGPDSNRDAIVRYIEAHPELDPRPSGSWRFKSGPKPLLASFESAPAAQALLAWHPAIRYAGEAGGGMARYLLSIA